MFSAVHVYNYNEVSSCYIAVNGVLISEYTQHDRDHFFIMITLHDMYVQGQHTQLLHVHVHAVRSSPPLNTCLLWSLTAGLQPDIRRLG